MVTIRRPVPADTAAIVRLRYRAFAATAYSPWMKDTHPLSILENTHSVYGILVRDLDQVYLACDDEGAILGWCKFHIKGPKTERHATWLSRLEAHLFTAETYLLHAHVYFRHLAWWKLRNSRTEIWQGALRKDLAETQKTLELERFVYVESLAIDPDTQKGGIGSRLLRVAMDVAQEQGIPLLLESSEQGYNFYMKKGFKEVAKPLELWDGDQFIARLPNLVWNYDAERPEL